MTILISHTTAALHWLYAEGRSGAFVGTAEITAAETSALACSDTLAHLYPNAAPYHVVVPSNIRKSSHNVKMHVLQQTLPAGSFIKGVAGTALASPELCFLQMGQLLNLADLIELGFSLCGRYRYDDFADDGFANRGPLTTCKELLSFARKHSALRGSRVALRALQYVKDGSASPAETHASMLATLPQLLGGYGFRDGQLNQRINLIGGGKIVASKSFYEADLCWPEHKLVLEYDSSLAHARPTDIARDAKKRNALLAMGWTVITLTADQLYNAAEMDKVAYLIAQRISGRNLKRVIAPSQTRDDLRQQLLLSGSFPERLGLKREDS